MKKLILTSIVIFSSYAAFSQYALWNLNYEVSFPAGETGDFIQKSSFRGGSIEGRAMLNDDFSLGGEIGWNVFYDKLDRATYSRGGVDITGVQVRYVNIIPVLLKGHYYFGDFSSLTPYVGLGAGGYKIEKRTEMGLIAIVEDNWHFGFTPEAGVFIPVNTDFGFNVSARYNYAFKSNESINHSYLSLSLGFSILEW